MRSRGGGINSQLWGCSYLYQPYGTGKLQLTREPRPLPIMVINPGVKDIDNFRYEDFTLTGYKHYPGIKGDVAI